MSEKVARLAVQLLRNAMFNALPSDIQSLIPMVSDPLVTGSQDQVPNIVVGAYQDFGANAGMIMIAVDCNGTTEPITRVYKHLDLDVDIWLSANQSPNVDGRRVVSILHEYIRRTLQETNWTTNTTSDFTSIQRCYETERSKIMFEGQNKIYHLSNRYRVEAISQNWY